MSNRTYALPGPASGAAAAVGGAVQLPCAAFGVTAGAAAVPLVLNARSNTTSKYSV